MTSLRACSVMWHAMLIRLLITVLCLRRFTVRLSLGFLLPREFLPYHAQNIVRQDGKLKNQLIRFKLPRRQPLKIHVGFQPALELSAFSMGMIVGDNVPAGKVRVHPPHIDFYIWDKEELSFPARCKIVALFQST